MTNVNSAKRKIIRSQDEHENHLTKECRHPAYYVFSDGTKAEGWCDLCRAAAAALHP